MIQYLLGPALLLAVIYISWKLFESSTAAAYRRRWLKYFFIGALLVTQTSWLQAQIKATTDCDSTGMTVWVSAAVIRSGEANEIIQHELVHVKQAQRFATCQAAMDDYNASSENIMRDEVEAYCVSLPVAVADGQNRRDRYEEYVRWVVGRTWAGNRVGLGPDVVRDAFIAQCPDVLPVDSNGIVGRAAYPVSAPVMPGWAPVTEP